ncbi:MAG TPA: DmsC/YnfH family molybdoenzyme membrane anchor subunit [Steroidobacteraceae bacterium]|nr:DmsC/YnfH family molybdoenzyme membrane anchor subunit [Steroidobacteraceae bacterium]
MNPAASVLLLTTATGFGYGLLAWIGACAALGSLPPARASMLVLAGVGIALLLASVGLAASMLHLGRKARAWRAFSQWRSSWLSREAVASVLAYPVAIAFAVTAARDGEGVWTRVLGLAALAVSLGTVLCTAMIYASLKPIRQWHNAHTAPDYLIYAIFSGAMLFALIRTVMAGAPGAVAGVAACAAAALALIAKWAYWRHVDAQTPLATLVEAIGLPAGTGAKPLDAPHFTENFVLREMGFVIARRHATRLRRIALLIGFVLPLAFSVLASVRLFPLAAATLAVVSAGLGLFIERWLFFAEATHVSALYYGRGI